jgi:aminocarboxymuconate-semialdehyde decarboxylase
VTHPVIDVHVHAVPHGLLDDVMAGEFAGVALEQGERTSRLRFPGTKPSPWLPAEITRIDAIVGWGRAKGIAGQLISPWTDLFGYTLPSQEAAAWSRRYNDLLVEECRPHAGALGIGTIPLSYPAVAVGVLEDAHRQGCRGIMIGTDIPDLHLGSAELNPVWEAAESLRMPVLVHPTHLHLPHDLVGAGLRNAVGRAGPTAVALARLIYGGALTRFSDLVIIASHGGGALPAVLPRILRNHELGWSQSAHDPRDSIDRLYFDSVVLDSDYLRYLIGRFGADRFLLGSDHPFPWEPDPVGTVVAAHLGGAQQRAVLGGNAARLFDLDQSETGSHHPSEARGAAP